jgi:hypothetical protein
LAWNTREAFDARPALRDGMLHDVVPTLASRNAHNDRLRIDLFHLHATHRQLNDKPGEPCVCDDNIAAAAEDKER